MGNRSASQAVRHPDGPGWLPGGSTPAWNSPAGETLFGSLRLRDARSLAGPTLEVNVTAGTQLVHEGELLGTFFVIQAGSAELMQGGRSHGELERGDCFGEIDPRDQEPQRFGVVASSPMRLLAFSTLGIGRLCAAIPNARERMLGALPA